MPYSSVKQINKTSTFLVEIGTEELPPKTLKKLSMAFAEGIKTELLQAELSYGKLEVFATPRRLAVRVNKLQTKQNDKTVEKKGPAKKAAFDSDGNATKALQGFSKGCGVSIESIQEIKTDKGIWMVYYQNIIGLNAMELLPKIIIKSLDKLPISKRMRWGNSKISFVRPVHWVLMLLDDIVIPANILGCEANNITYGHRFHSPQAIKISDPLEYEKKLYSQGFVIANFKERSDCIKNQLTKICEKLLGDVVIDDLLLEEVTALNEWPVSVMGGFDKEFLAVPAEALISAMKGHQKYFHMVDKAGKLIPHFVTIANIDSKNMQSVIEGNEKVIRPRLNDARFFWQQDSKKELQEFLPMLKTNVFQQELGSLFDKTKRLEKLVTFISKKMSLNSELQELCYRSATLSKCDLMSSMVAEFPDLQGIMGSYYALKNNEESKVAIALHEQYQPRFSADITPKTITGQILALSDKLDTITGIYGIGKIPTGDKDPFALKRSALGIVRIMVENEIDLNLRDLIIFSMGLHSCINSNTDIITSIHEFILGRLNYYYLDKGISQEQFNSVKVCNPNSPLEFHKRIKAVKVFLNMPEAEDLTSANKRITNILKKCDGQITAEINLDLLIEKAELDLYKKLLEVKSKVTKSIAVLDYTAAITDMATMRNKVDVFFLDVMVMVEDESIRDNRLILLQMVQQMFKQVADISRLDTL